MSPDKETTTSAQSAGFWWTIEFETAPGANREWDEERLMNLAVASGCIGSEMIERDDGHPSIRAHYLGADELSALVASVNETMASYEGVAICGCYKTERREWNEQSLKAFPPLKVGHGLIVMAPWHREEDRQGRLPIYIYPSTAFGTGYHESTRIALELIEDTVRRGDVILDIGAGTGVLFITALKLGASKAIARDTDPATIDEMRRNMNLNGLSFGLCDMGVGNLLTGITEKGNIIAANILLAPNLAMLPDIRRVLKPKGHAIFSGITGLERGTFMSVLSGSGLKIEKELRFGDWWGCCARAAWGY